MKCPHCGSRDTKLSDDCERIGTITGAGLGWGGAAKGLAAGAAVGGPPGALIGAALGALSGAAAGNKVGQHLDRRDSFYHCYDCSKGFKK